MPKRKLKPIGRKLGGLKKATLPKRKTSALARPKPMTGKKFTSKLTAKGVVGGLTKGKTKRSVPKRKPPAPIYPAPKPPRRGGSKPRPPRRKKSQRNY